MNDGRRGEKLAGVLLVAVLMAFETIAVADPGAKAPTTPASAARDSEFERFLAKQEKQMEAVRKRLLARIDARANDVRRAKGVDPDDIRRNLEAIDEDREAFVKHDRLPDSDILIDDVVTCLDDFQRVAAAIEKHRAQMTKRAVRVDDPAAMTRLKQLETRLASIQVGGDVLAKNSTWAGERQTEDGAFQLRLTITERAGGRFAGELTQIAARGSRSLMRVEGEVRGHGLRFTTTEMIRGKSRQLNFQGYVLTDRIITEFAGVGIKGQPLQGWVSLEKDAPTQRERRRHRKRSNPS